MSFWRKNARACKHSGKAQLPLGRHAVKSSVAIVVRCSIGFMPSSNLASNQTRCMSCSPLEGLQPKSARIEPKNIVHEKPFRSNKRAVLTVLMQLTQTMPICYEHCGGNQTS